MGEGSYKILYDGGVGEIVEKKSRFIATARKINNEEEALSFISEMRKKYWDASHNCYAFVAGENHRMQRCSDDGEPSGTAGRPMLEVLLREGIHDTAIVVTRYFGGTLLGTGGLVRAYQKAVQEGLKNSLIIEKRQGRILTIQTNYNGIGKIQHILRQREITVIDTQYTDRVGIQAMVPIEMIEILIEEIMEGTGGSAFISRGKTVEFALLGKEIKLF